MDSAELGVQRCRAANTQNRFGAIAIDPEHNVNGDIPNATGLQYSQLQPVGDDDRNGGASTAFGLRKFGVVC